MKVMVILATMLSVIPVICAFFLPNWYLGDKQNAVDDADSLAGETDVDDAAGADEEEEEEEILIDV